MRRHKVLDVAFKIQLLTTGNEQLHRSTTCGHVMNVGSKAQIKFIDYEPMDRNLIFYTLVVIVCGSLLWIVFDQEAMLETPLFTTMDIENTTEKTSPDNHAFVMSTQDGAVVVFLTSLLQSVSHPLSLLLIQIVIIVLSSKLLASLVSKIGQPLVIGEIIAGILLGPSVLGHFWAQLSEFIFQPASLPNLNLPSQHGLRLPILINSTEQAAEAQLTFAGLPDHFEQVISVDEIHRLKPAPEVVHWAA
jgi:hypothetical protein